MKKIKILPVRWIPEKHDTDGDGVPNCKDCNPWNPHKQGKEYGIFQIDTNEYGHGVYGIFKQKHMGASIVKSGSPVFIGSKEECQMQLSKIPYNPEYQKSSW